MDVAAGIAAGAPLGVRAAQRVAPAVGAAEALTNEALGELRRHERRALFLTSV